MSEPNISVGAGWDARAIKSKLRRGAATEIAKKLGCSRVAVYNVIARRHRSSRIEAALAQRIGIPAEEIFGPPTSPYRPALRRAVGETR